VRLTRSTVRRAAIVAAAAGLFGGALLAPSSALAAPLSIASANTLAEQLDSPGTYLQDGRLVVTVTDEAQAAQVRSAGGVARVVKYSAAQLDAVTSELYSSARVVGSAWAVDPMTNQVLVSIDESVTSAGLAQITAVTSKMADRVRIEKVSGTFQTFISGGQAIYTSGSRCSLGFNVQNTAGQRFFLTAGHCTNIGSSWSASSGGSVIGVRTNTSFPGNDYGMVRYNAGVANPGNVWLYSGSTTRDITSAATPAVNSTVQRSGSTTGVRSGRVTALNATVTYPQGSVSGLIRTTVCAQPGDSGGSLFSGSTAHGLTSGGSGNCTTGGTTFFQPVVEPLSVYGVRVY